MAFAFFRRNKKLILYIMVILMVAFLVPSAFQSCSAGDPGQIVVAHAYGNPIKGVELQRAANQISILNALGTDWHLRRRIPNAQVFLLLQREAEQMGLMISDEQVREFYAANALSGPELSDLLRQLQISERDLTAAVKAHLLVVSCADGAISAIKVSEPMLKEYYRDLHETVRVSLLRINAVDFLDEVEEPEDATLLEHFNTYKTFIAGGDSGPFGFGYKYPERIRVEYLMASVDQLSAEVFISDDEAERFYKENLDDYKIAPPDTEEPQEAVDEVAYTQFEEVRDDIIDELGLKRAADRAGDIMARVVGIVGSTADADADGPDLRQVADQVQQQFKTRLRYVRTDLLTRAEASSEAFIGRADLPQPFTSFAFSVKELRPEGTPAQGGFSVGRISSTFRDADGNRFIFRVLEAVKAKQPSSMKEVKADVTDDVMLLEAYRLAEKKADELHTAAKDGDLESVLPDNSPWQVSRPEPFSRLVRPYLITPLIEGVGQHEEFVDGCFAIAASPTQVGVIALDGPRLATVVKVEELTPVSRQAYERDHEYALGELTAIARRQMSMLWFSPLSIARRTRFEQPKGDEEELGLPAGG